MRLECFVCILRHHSQSNKICLQLAFSQSIFFFFLIATIHFRCRSSPISWTNIIISYFIWLVQRNDRSTKLRWYFHFFLLIQVTLKLPEPFFFQTISNNVFVFIYEFFTWILRKHFIFKFFFCVEIKKKVFFT